MLQDFDAATEVDHNSLAPQDVHNAFDCLFVNRRSGSNAKGTLRTRGYKSHAQDEDTALVRQHSSALATSYYFIIGDGWIIHTCELTT